MITETGNNIVKFIKEHGEATAKELVDFLLISPQAVFRQLKKLQDRGRITKFGSPPRVFYVLAGEKQTAVELKDRGVGEFINNNYLYVTPDGLILEGVGGFVAWCKRNGFEPNKTAREYVVTSKKYTAFRHSGLIDGRAKLKQTFKDVYLDKLFYLDFYSIERFGKTKLGAMLLYAKQGQDKKLIKKISEMTQEIIKKLIKSENIQAIGFIPPTIVRRVQLQKELEKFYAISLPKIKILKATNQIAVPQKSLNKLSDRIINAKNTIFVEGGRVYKTVLLIDDAVGSGATLNETARKIKGKMGDKTKVIGLALTGSFKGFDVISEV
ncbi:MarR family transcriptional regulator [Patescibacteria group bacterium]|nr:MarR family transcriptional regulator [Patescibacteria group bacterium]